MDRPAIPAVTLRPLLPAEFAGYRASFIRDWAADLVRVEDLSPADAVREATRRTDASLPQGFTTLDHHLYAILSGTDRVGTLWFSVADGHAFLDDITIDEAARGQGHGRRALVQLEALARALGLVRIDLHVYRDNPRAIALYEQLGYRTTGLKMRKSLS
ncbi:MAG: GNAT family N-acetyltransferase [Kofleriaceae bacterium]